MSTFRGSDEALEREIETVRGLVQLRLRRASGELRELERALRELRRERARRRGVPVGPEGPVGAPVASA